MTIQRAIFLYEDVGKDATMSAFSAAAQFPAVNAANELRQIPYRSGTITAGQYLQWTSPAAVAPNCLVAFDHNLSAGATDIKVRSSTSSTFASGNTDLVTVTYTAGVLFATWTAGSTRLYHRLEWADAANTDGYHQFGRVMLGTYFQPATNYELPFERGYIDNGVLNVSMNDVAHGIIKPIRRTRKLKFPVFSLAELNKWRDFYEYAGKIRPFAAILDATNDPIRETIYGRFLQPIENPVVHLNVDEIMVGLAEAA